MDPCRILINKGENNGSSQKAESQAIITFLTTQGMVIRQFPTPFTNALIQTSRKLTWICEKGNLMRAVFCISHHYLIQTWHVFVQFLVSGLRSKLESNDKKFLCGL